MARRDRRYRCRRQRSGGCCRLSDRAHAARRAGGRVALSLGPRPSSSRSGSLRCSQPIPTTVSTKRSTQAARAVAATQDEARRHAAAAPHEGGGRVAHRARRHRRRVAGHGGHSPADRTCGHGRQRRRRVSAGRRAAPRPLAGSPTPICTRPKVCGYFVLAMGKMGASELNYSSDIDLIVFYDAACAALAAGHRAGGVLRAAHARAGEAAAGAHARRLRVPHRSAAAAGPILDPDRHLDRLGARLLRERRTELGARRADQGAARAPATSRPAKRCCGTSRRSSGASISISPRSPTSMR